MAQVILVSKQFELASAKAPKVEKMHELILLPSRQRNRYIKPRNSGGGGCPAPLFLDWEGSIFYEKRFAMRILSHI